MSRVAVGKVIEKLLTDENLRIRFALDRMETVAELFLRGFDLCQDEIELFSRTDADLWFLGEPVRERTAALSRRCANARLDGGRRITRANRGSIHGSAGRRSYQVACTGHDASSQGRPHSLKMFNTCRFTSHRVRSAKRL